MNEYDFTLKFALPSPDANLDDCVEQLGAAGCDDALIGVGRRGRVALAFTREGETAELAVLSAIADVKSALPDARLVEAAPDLVGLTDVAELLDVSRQNMRKLILTSRAEPPVPVHEGKPTIWRLSKLLLWLREEKNYPVEEGLISLAKATMQVNLAVELRDADEILQAELRALVA